MKKTFLPSLICFAFLVFSAVSVQAENDTSYEHKEFSPPRYSEINLKAKQVDKEVHLEWSQFRPQVNETLQWYKIVKSTSNNNPTYPEDDMIGYTENIERTEFVETWANKSAYYRVCAITHQKTRSCSNVVWIDYKSPEKDEKKYYEKKAKHYTEKNYEKKYTDKTDYQKKEYYEKKYDEKPHYEKKEYTKSYDKKTTELSSKIRQRLDAWLSKLEQRLKASDASNEHKRESLTKLQNKLEALGKKKPGLWPVVKYLNNEINQMKAEYEDDLEDIEAIFNEFF